MSAAAQDPKQWRAAAWALERLYPERYGRRKPGTITHEQLFQLIAGLRKQLAGGRRKRRESPFASRTTPQGTVPETTVRAPDAKWKQQKLQNLREKCSLPEPWPNSESVRREATPQNSRGKNPRTIEKTSHFSPPSRAVAAAQPIAPPQNHPPIGEKTENPSRKSPPLLVAAAENREKRFLRDSAKRSSAVRRRRKRRSRFIPWTATKRRVSKHGVALANRSLPVLGTRADCAGPCHTKIRQLLGLPRHLAACLRGEYDAKLEGSHPHFPLRRFQRRRGKCGRSGVGASFPSHSPTGRAGWGLSSREQMNLRMKGTLNAVQRVFLPRGDKPCPASRPY